MLDEPAARVRIHLGGNGAGNPYEFRGGEPILLAGGMLLESLRIAASAQARGCGWTLHPSAGPGRWIIDAQFPPEPGRSPDPLLSALPMRSVERRPLRRTRVPLEAKQALQDALGPDLVLTWHEGVRARTRLARLGAAATAIRLRAPETFAVHRDVVDWSQARSPHGLPARAIGLDRVTLRLMRWGMASWTRMRRLNAVLGTGGAALQLDMLPGLRCAAFFSVKPARDDAAPDQAALLRDGESLQRFWLTATRLGLGLQPALATLIFADHGARGTPFTDDPGLLARAARLAAAVSASLGPVQRLRFLGRIGGRFDGPPGPRSVRRPLSALLAGSAGSGAADGLRIPKAPIASDERPDNGLLPTNPLQDGVDRANGGLPGAMELDHRPNRNEMNGGRAEQA